MTMTIHTVQSHGSPAPVAGLTAAADAGNAPILDPGASLMPDPRSGDVGLAVAKMMIESAFARRKQAREDRRDAATAMGEAQKRQIEHMRKAASEKKEAASLSATGKVAEGALGVIGGCTKLDGAEGDPWSPGGKALGGIADVVAAGVRESADLREAAAKECENEASLEKRAVDDADDEIKAAREHARVALDFLRDFESTRTKAMSSAIKA